MHPINSRSRPPDNLFLSNYVVNLIPLQDALTKITNTPIKYERPVLKTVNKIKQRLYKLANELDKPANKKEKRSICERVFLIAGKVVKSNKELHNLDFNKLADDASPALKIALQASDKTFTEVEQLPYLYSVPAICTDLVKELEIMLQPDKLPSNSLLRKDDELKEQIATFKKHVTQLEEHRDAGRFESGVQKSLGEIDRDISSLQDLLSCKGLLPDTVLYNAPPCAARLINTTKEDVKRCLSSVGKRYLNDIPKILDGKKLLLDKLLKENPESEA